MANHSLITTLAAGFTAAWLLGLLMQKLRLSPIVGYLLAGILIGPHTPGYSGDPELAPQLAEIGVILLMFGVGLHFHLKDLLAVQSVALPGAIGQSALATVLGVLVALAFGMSFKTGLVLGMSMAVASTVVLIRGLTNSNMLETTHGHVAVGWLIVEDIFTVVLLVLIPALGGAATGSSVGMSLLIALVNLAVLVALLLLAGSRIIPWIMIRVARLRSRELFTLTVLVMAIAIAAGSYYVFGASMALGAFLAGMVVGQSPVSHQAGADALPMRDAFAVLFFISVGMLFDPSFLVEQPLLVLAGLGIVMIGKPLAALLLVAATGYPVRTGLTVAFGLAQIGEFSFILSEVARAHNLMTDAGHNLIVATAILSITVNPFLFHLIDPAERWLRKVPWLWRLLNGRSARRTEQINAASVEQVRQSNTPVAVIVGFGPVGRTVDQILRGDGVETVVVDLNMDTVEALKREGRIALYGDASNEEVMRDILKKASHLLITLPHGTNRGPLIALARHLNPDIVIFVRARYLREREELEMAGADAACFEEAEAAVALARLVLARERAESDRIQKETLRIRRELRAEYRGMPD